MMPDKEPRRRLMLPDLYSSPLRQLRKTVSLPRARDRRQKVRHMREINPSRQVAIGRQDAHELPKGLFDMAEVVVDNVAAIVAGKRPPNCWNAGIYAGAGTEEA